jgi:hypothetical protein
MAGTYIQGKNFVLKKKFIDTYYKVACGKSVAFDFANDIILKTDVNAGLFKKKRVRISDFSASFNGLIKSDNTVDYVSGFHFLEEGVRRAQSDYQCVFTDDAGNIIFINFKAVIESVNIAGTVGNYTEYDVALQGTEGFSQTTTPFPAATDYEIISDWWPTVADQDYVDVGGVDSGRLGLRMAADDIILEVDREGFQHDEAAVPAGRQYKFDTGTLHLEFDAALPFNGSETVFVLWKRPL